MPRRRRRRPTDTRVYVLPLFQWVSFHTPERILIDEVTVHEIGPSLCVSEIGVLGIGTDMSDDNPCTALQNLLKLYKQHQVNIY